MKELLVKARELDRLDPLKKVRQSFELEKDTTYLDGNSLGPLPKKSKEIIQASIENQWGKRLIRSWNEDWLACQERTATKIAQLINADPKEVIVCDSVSVNLYKLAFAALKHQKGKNKVISDNLNFPSDLYIFQGLIKDSFTHTTFEIIKQKDLSKANENIKNAIDSQTALLSLSHVAYKSCFQYDVKSINELAKANGTLNLWDLSHSVGAVKIDVKEMGMDMAVGCTYKFLNAGPGAPAFIYIKKELSKDLKNPIAGWFSHAKPFDFDQNFENSPTAKGFLVGTPPILSLKGIESGVDLFLENDQNLIWQKSKELFEYFELLFNIELKSLGFKIGTPLDFKQRGSHIALLHEEAYRINLALINPSDAKWKIFITDHRPPNIVRIALTPLYQSFEELYELVLRLKNIMDKQEYLNHSIEKTGVI